MAVPAKLKRTPAVVYPYKKLVMPKALAGQKNGRLPDSLLSPIDCGGQMWDGAAVAFNALFAAAAAAGITLKNIGDYRPYSDIMAMFNDRYSIADQGRKPQVTRKFDGRTWYLKKGKAPSAAPDPSGKTGSNHGWGLAIDLGVVSKKRKGTVSLSSAPKALAWMCANAPVYGFYLQGSDPKSPEFEAWHWQYCLGDKKPAILNV
jgi:LAS superfamily LD-carboxypeptidase LdcB